MYRPENNATVQNTVRSVDYFAVGSPTIRKNSYENRNTALSISQKRRVSYTETLKLIANVQIRPVENRGLTPSGPDEFLIDSNLQRVKRRSVVFIKVFDIDGIFSRNISAYKSEIYTIRVKN